MTNFNEVTVVKEALKVVVKLARTTYEALSQAIQHPYQQPASTHLASFSKTLEHISEVREGFMLCQRVQTSSELAELQYITRPATLDWDWLAEYGLSLKPSDTIETLASQLIVYQHTMTVLGIVPQLPAEVITFPQLRPTYADLYAPKRPSQMLERIEELERVLYRATMVPLDELTFDALRRTYAFFETSVWVINHHLTGILAD